MVHVAGIHRLTIGSVVPDHGHDDAVHMLFGFVPVDVGERSVFSDDVHNIPAERKEGRCFTDQLQIMQTFHGFAFRRDFFNEGGAGYAGIDDFVAARVTGSEQ